MVRALGAMAPARLLILLLLVALRAQDVMAAPWRARGLGRWAGEGQHPVLAVWRSTHSRAGVLVGQGQVSRGQLRGQQEADAPWGGAGGCSCWEGIFQVNGGAGSRAVG